VFSVDVSSFIYLEYKFNYLGSLLGFAARPAALRSLWLLSH